MPFFQKNWDKVAEEELSDKEDDPSDPDAFFKMLYENADEDARRAMLKSYTESNGTALSTNWEEVSKKKVEVTPPQGTQAKQW
jgi:suppressor of G2 allele of SKP1